MVPITVVFGTARLREYVDLLAVLSIALNKKRKWVCGVVCDERTNVGRLAVHGACGALAFLRNFGTLAAAIHIPARTWIIKAVADSTEPPNGRFKCLSRIFIDSVSLQPYSSQRPN